MRQGWIAAALVFVAARPAFSQDAATLSFATNHAGSIPRSMIGEETIKVDLSALPPGVPVYRAVLRPGRIEGELNRQRDVPIRVTLKDREEPLQLLAPRYTAFDVTEEVRAALASGSRSVSFSFHHFPAYQAVQNRLDVTCGAKAKNEIPRVWALSARHRAGQTLLTWMEPGLKGAAERLTFQELSDLRASLALQPKRTTYRIYRSAERITAATIGKAELIDEIEPLSGWDAEYSGIHPNMGWVVPRYVVRDGGNPVPPGTAVYAHNPKTDGAAYYAVSLAVAGEEDLSAFSRDDALEEPVEERTGQGAPVLQRIEYPGEFNYVQKPALHFYVRWECPPNASMPSRPIAYLVAIPPKPVEPAPVGLHLHCWGGNLEGGYGWWYDAAQGAILISTNEIPYDWWTGYHECLGTWKCWRDGVVRDYTQTRLISFLDWAATQWKIDRARVFTAGNSMGGSGSPSVALRRSDRIAWCVSWVGVHRPADSPQFTSSYERVFGDTAWKLPFQDRKSSAFDYFDDAAYVRRDPGRETPLIVFSNGKNDGAIGWAQAREFWAALQETHRPHVFRWGLGGHGQRALLPGPDPAERELGVDVRLDRTLPAFTRCSLDQDPGDGDPKNGAQEGQSNLYLLWDTAPEKTVDEVGRWSLELKLGRKAPRAECTVDVTPRRTFQFRTPAGTKASWRNLSDQGEEIQAGVVTADAWGRVTIPGVTVTTSGNRLVVESAR
ncbi:MAG TPA: prolyl oligopeptidase family serine peptidase [Planctomycetota bacterium]|nr:prolyl oligopeptidase family serine peptidase [Planctomycetota bacterium]